MYSTGESPTSTEANNALGTLNAMISGMANNNLLLYTQELDVIPLKSGKGIYTVGPYGDVETVRPLRVDMTSYVDYQGVSFQLAVLTIEEYNKIPVKNWNSPFPLGIWYQETWPNMTVTCYPTPSSDCDLYLWSWKPQPGWTSLEKWVSLPPGYEEMLAYNLAESLAPEYMVSVPPEVSKKAALTKKALISTNFTPAVMDLPSVLTSGYGGLGNSLLSTSSSAPAPAPQDTLTEWDDYPRQPIYVSENSFSVSGDATDVFQVKRRVNILNVDGSEVFGTVTGADYNSSTAATTIFCLLDDGSTLGGAMDIVSYGMLSAVHPSMPMIYAPIDSPSFTGSPTAPSPADDDNSLRLATTMWSRNVLAPINSPALTGTPTSPTPDVADSSTKIATTAWGKQQFTELMSATIDFTGEVSASAPLGDDDNSSRVATTSFVVKTRANTVFPPEKNLDMGGYKFVGLMPGSETGDSVALEQLAPYAPLNSPTLTGVPQAPTPEVSDYSNKIATTAYVRNYIGPAYIPGYISGLSILAESGSLLINAGVASCGFVMAANAKAMSKTIYAWSAGSGNGGCLDGGTVLPNTWYYLYIIQNPTTNAVDFGFSIQPPWAVPSKLPSGFTNSRYIGMLPTIRITDGAQVAFKGVSSLGDRFFYNTVGSTPSLPMICGPTQRTYQILFAPPRFFSWQISPISIFGALSIFAQDIISSDTPVYIGPVWQQITSTDAVSGLGDFFVTKESVNNYQRVNSFMNIGVNYLGELITYAPGANLYCDITVRGWVDDRGLNAAGISDTIPDTPVEAMPFGYEVIDITDSSESINASTV